MRIDLVEKAEELVREQNMSNHVDEIASAVINARVSLGMGINLEKTCPYIRECDSQLQLPSRCVGPQNYRNMPCYQTALELDAHSGRFSLLPNLLEVAN